jgi:hypothetical protein
MVLIAETASDCGTVRTTVPEAVVRSRSQAWLAVCILMVNRRQTSPCYLATRYFGITTTSSFGMASSVDLSIPR